MLFLKFVVFGDTQIDRALSRFGDEIKDFRPVWQQLRGDFLRIEREQFRTAGARGGATWRPLSPSYAAWKAQHAPGQPLLVLEGEMRNELTTGHGMVTTMQPLHMRLHPTNPRALWHQRGTSRGLPSRPVVMLNPGDKIRWLKMMHEYVWNAARKRGLMG